MTWWMNVLLALLGAPVVMGLVVWFCAWSVHQHARSYEGDVERVKGPRGRRAGVR